jgi:hypothetical protein
MKKQFLTLAFMVGAMAVSHGQGSITFANTIASRILLCLNEVQAVPVPGGTPIVYGVFWGPQGTPADRLQLNSGALGSPHFTSPGLISAASPYIIDGAAEQSTVSMQIRAWSASFGRDWQAALRTPGAFYGETDVRDVRLLATAGPGAIIWQSAAGTAPDRFRPFVVGYTTFSCPEPTAMALLAFGLGGLLLFRRRRKS